jgi:hypothetical protein
MNLAGRAGEEGVADAVEAVAEEMVDVPARVAMVSEDVSGKH